MNKSSVGWHHVLDAGYGSTGEAFHSTLNNNAFSIPERLARESLQNSRDAVRKDAKLSASFRFSNLLGADKKALIDALGLGSLATKSKYLGLKPIY